MHFVFITGGVASSLGKGIASASLATLLKSRKFKVRIRKLDPYLTEEQKALTHETNGKVIAKERVGWASSYLSQGGCLVRPKRGYMNLGPNA